MAELKLYVGDAAIGRAIRGLNTRLGNINTDIQAIAVSIVEHAANAGNGDMSRFLELCKVVAKHRTLNVAYLIGWGRAFGRVNTNLRAKDGAGQVSLIKDKSFDVLGAKHNNWYEAVVDGVRAAWYAGPVPAEFQPATIGDVAEDFRRFVKRELDKLEGTKEIGGKVVPLVDITPEDKVQLANAFDFINKLANTLARREDVMKKIAEAEAAKAEAEADVDPQVEAILQPEEKMVA